MSTITDLIARLRADAAIYDNGDDIDSAQPMREAADALETLQRERDEAVLDAERARQDRAHVGVEIRREWMAKCADLQRDAERYRWLREPGTNCVTLDGESFPALEDLDAAIDAAIKSGSEG